MKFGGGDTRIVQCTDSRSIQHSVEWCADKTVVSAVSYVMSACGGSDKLLEGLYKVAQLRALIHSVLSTCTSALRCATC